MPIFETIPDPLASDFPATSQTGQCLILAEYVRNVLGNPPHGWFLDVGAADGRTFSNTVFMLDSGWQGVYVEGSPTAVADLMRAHGRNPKVEIVNALLSPDPRELVAFHESALVGSIDAAHVAKWAPTADYAKCWCPTISPAAIVRLLDQIKLGHSRTPTVLSLDVEGITAAIASGLLAAGLRPSIAVVETDSAAERRLADEAFAAIKMRPAYTHHWDTFYTPFGIDWFPSDPVRAKAAAHYESVCQNRG